MKHCQFCGREYPDDAKICDICNQLLSEESALLDQKMTTSGMHVGMVLGGRYEILEMIGLGGMGKVYKARDRARKGELVAVKMLNRNLSVDTRSLEDLVNESNITMKLSHPNVMRLHNFEDRDDYRFLVMEYIEGPTLDKILDERRKLTEEEAFFIGRQICEGLAYAHSQKVVHRDLKPSNLMLTRQMKDPEEPLTSEDIQVKICDFGIARVAKDRITRLTGRLTSGTLMYMSPEQIRGIKLDHRSDIYSLGCVLYELLAGQPPFYSGDITHQHLREQPRPIKSLSPMANDIILRALEKDPSKRFQNAKDFGDALSRTSEEKTSKVAKKKKKSILATVSLFFILACLASGFILLKYYPDTLPDRLDYVRQVKEKIVPPPPVPTTTPPPQPILNQAPNIARAGVWKNEFSWNERDILQFQWVANDSDNDTVSFKWRCDGEEWQLSMLTETALPVLPTGIHTFDVIAVDERNNESEMLSHQFEITNAAPEITWQVRPPVDETVRPSGSMEVSLYDSDGTVAECYFAVNDREDVRKINEGILSLDNLPDGDYTVYAWCVDDAGVKSKEIQTHFAVKRNTSPVVTVAFCPKEVMETSPVTIELQGQDDYDDNLEFRYWLNDHIEYNTTTFPKIQLLDLKPGEYLFRAAAVDSDGAVSEESTARFTINKLRPDHPLGEEYTEKAQGLNIKMVWISEGEFMMGSPENEIGHKTDESPQHNVKIYGFYMSECETTQQQYETLVGTNPSYFKGEAMPVEKVSWEDAMNFCYKLSQATGKVYTLPTEAQWEYACRAGTTTPFNTGATIIPTEANYNCEYVYGNGYKETPCRKTKPVGAFPCNAFNLHDMHGNVWEWCADCEGGKYTEKEDIVVNPTGPPEGTSHVKRGGCWETAPELCRSANRGTEMWSEGTIGFRVVMVPKEK